MNDPKRTHDPFDDAPTLGRDEFEQRLADDPAPEGSAAQQTRPATLDALEADMVVAGRYRLVERLGQGGFGVVWKVEDIATRPTEERQGELFALKLLAPQLRDDERGLALVQLEAQKAMQLAHPNIARTHDFVPDASFPAIKMELLEGASVNQLLANAARQAGQAAGLGSKTTCEIAEQVVTALDYAHQAEVGVAGRTWPGVVHRDLKPANVFIAKTSSGMRAKLLDFGTSEEIQHTFARLADGDQNAVSGTPQYMSPQQIAGRPANAQDDVWSLGVLIYECLRGHVPWRTEVVLAKQFDEHAPPRPDELSEAQWRVLLGDDTQPGALAVDPSRRFATAGEFWQAFCASAAKDAALENETTDHGQEDHPQVDTTDNNVQADNGGTSGDPIEPAPPVASDDDAEKPSFTRRVITIVHGLAAAGLVGWFWYTYVRVAPADDVGWAKFMEAWFLPINLPYTILLGFAVLYWLMVIIGFFDLEFLDLDFDADTDFDLDGDIDGGGHFGISMLNYFNVGEVPMMVLFGVLALFLWTVSLLANHYLQNTGEMIAAQLILPNLVVSLFATKLLTAPLKRAFKSDAYATEDLQGQVCRVTTSRADAGFGQAQMKRKGAPLLLNVRTEGDERLAKGDTVRIVRYDAARQVHVVSKSSSEG